MLKKRKDLADWPDGSLIWSTQFNDLRKIESSGTSPEVRRENLRMELKKQGLLQSHTLIRDADSVNNIDLLDLVDSNVDAIQSGIAHGTHVFGLRSDAESLTQVNDNAGLKRAYPERFEKVKLLVKNLDILLEQSEVVVADVKLPVGNDVFNDNIKRLLGSSHLSASESDMLRLAHQTATVACNSKLLRFGDLYDELVRHKAQAPESNLLQWCRAAHVLAAPASIGLPPSSANDDIHPVHAAFFCGVGNNHITSSAPWLELFPRNILTDRAVRALTFEDIVRCRRHGLQIGYFEASNRLHSELGSSNFERSFISYLKSLEEYLIAISLEAKVELVDWQKEVTRRYFTERTIIETTATWGIPVILAVGYSLITHAPLPIDEAGAIGAGLEALRRFRRARKPAQLERLLKGTTVSLPYKTRQPT
jgi:hypothetical protein